MTILSIDPGKFKSVACLFRGPDVELQFHTVNSDPQQFRKLITPLTPDVVVFETCTAAGWVADLCDLMEVNDAVANPSGEAWRWKNVKRKTDRDDALKLARLYHMGELPTVYMPPYAVRAKRSLLKFRESSVRNGCRSRTKSVPCFRRRGCRWLTEPDQEIQIDKRTIVPSLETGESLLD